MRQYKDTKASISAAPTAAGSAFTVTGGERARTATASRRRRATLQCAPSADICSLHTKRLERNGGLGYCAGCEAQLKREAAASGAPVPLKGKTWQELCLDQGLPQVVDYDGGVIYPNMVDDFHSMLGTTLATIQRNRERNAGDVRGCETDHKRRPDVIWTLHDPDTQRITHALVLEVDEHSHGDRKVKCELSRVDDLAQSINQVADELFRRKGASATRRPSSSRCSWSASTRTRATRGRSCRWPAGSRWSPTTAPPPRASDL